MFALVGEVIEGYITPVDFPGSACNSNQGNTATSAPSTLERINDL
jgi:hypothetical protein